MDRGFSKLFVDHPKSKGLSYAAHCLKALGHAGECLIAAAALSVHAFVPGLFITTGSERVVKMAEAFREEE